MSMRLHRPERDSTSEHRSDRRRPEIAPVEGGWDVCHEQENLSVLQSAAALPGDERSSTAVSRQGVGNMPAVDGQLAVLLADELPADRGDALQQRHAER